MPSSPERSIGLVTWDFDPPRGGLGRAMQMLTATLREIGYTVHVLHPGKHPILRWTQVPGGQVLFSMLLPFVFPRWIQMHQISCVLYPVGPGGILHFPVAQDRILRARSRGNEPRLREGIVPGGVLQISSAAATRGSLLRKVAIVYHTYAQQAQCVPGERWKHLFVPLERRALDRADAILCYSADTVEHLHERGISAQKIHLLPQIFDVRAWIPPAPVPKIPGRCIAVMRLDPRKGIGTLLAAWPLVRAHAERASLLLIGKGRGARAVAALVSRDASVRFIPELAQEDLLRCIAEAEIALCPSHLEGFGLAAVEAELLGTALIATDVPGLRSLVRNGETGVLVPPGAPRALADAVLTLLRDRPLRERLAREAKRFARDRFDPRSAREALERALESVCSP